YKTIHLDRWWNNLTPEWKALMLSKLEGDTTREALHRLVLADAFRFQDVHAINDLTPLNEFVRLKSLHFSGTGVTQIPELESLRSLESLHATNSPLQRLGVIVSLTALEDLNIANTPRSEEHTSELQSRENLVCRLLLEKKNITSTISL